MPETLAQKIKAKYPGQYDDLSDQELEAKVTAKYPGAYDDIPRTPASGGAMNFATVNGQRVPVDDGPIDFAAGVVHSLNPIPAINAVAQGLPIPKALGGGGVLEGPQNLLKGLLDAQNHVKAGADDAWAKGDYKTAVRKYADWLLPIIGPAMDASADKMAGGQPFRGAGEAVGLGLGLAGPKAIETAQIKVPAVAKNPNPAEVAAVEFGQARGVPIDAATASGNLFVKGAQKSADATPIGAVVASRFKQAQAQALSRVGEELASEAHPTPIAPEQAGAGVRGAVEQLIGNLHKQANDAYGRLRKYEADPEHAADVPKPLSPEEASLKQAINARAKSSIGRVPTDEEWAEMRRIRDELDAVQYEKGGTVENANLNRGTLNDWTDGDMRKSSYVRRSANAPVYHDILQTAPGTSAMTGREMRVAIDQALSSGSFTNAARGALEVAKKRIAGHVDIASAMFEQPGTVPPREMAPMALPVDLTLAKQMLRPVYDRMMRQLPITQQRSSPGLKAIENILNGPDYAPVTQVDTDLGIIKGLARGADLPELRDMSQGIAAAAVKHLDQAVRDAVANAGPDAVAALEEGRSATRAKYAAAETLRKVSTEPVQAFKSAVWAKDAGIKQLRELSELAPAEMPKIGRAYLDDLLSQATAEGGFDKTGRLQAEWLKLGPETKKILFPDAGQIEALDKYFLLAKKIGENPNPSGTAPTLAAGATGVGLLTQPHVTLPAVLAAGGISKILRSPAALRLFSRGASLALGPGRTSRAAFAAGLADVLKAAREAGVTVGAPAAGPASPAGQPGQP